MKSMTALLLACLLTGSLLSGCTGQQRPATTSGPEGQTSSSLPAEEGSVSANYQQTALTFPAYQDGRDQHNASVYDTEPFILSLALPEGWAVRQPEDPAFTIPSTPMELYNGDRLMGSVGFYPFELYEDTTDENFYRSVYNQLMLGSVVNWDNDYTPVVENETIGTAICTIVAKETGEEWAGRMADAPEHRMPAILSYDTNLLVYVGLAFEEDAGITEEELLTIAKSIHLSRP